MTLTSRSRALSSIALLGAAALGLASCAFASESSDSASSSDDASLPTLTAGTLTIATGEPAYEPWVVDDDPSNGEGFEAAVAYAVAEQLGFDDSDVEWVRSTFDSAIAPGQKDWDLNIQQFSVTEEREQAVDFSSPYYTTSQAVVTSDSSAAAGATTIDELSSYDIGVMSGTTSYTVAAAELGDDALSVFNSNDDVVLAFQSGQIDAFVVDLPTAFYLSSAEIDGGTIVGQFADTSGGDDLAFVLPKDSELTDPVTAAVDALREDGTLDELEQTWLSDAVDVPVLG
ncbi:ABC transporter substrate-binding protein [Microbacterium indicum]|uniref:ABC transporter substrate-binding protein n=1 Tax=Microbacterium indicum TaxID=358100 RepID=UPI0004207E27|nr:ABC transporter substrate-binding protein [Microbacterium indicum]